MVAHLGGLSPMLQTDKFSETIDFYVSVLGFTWESRNDEWGWAALRRNEVGIMIAMPLPSQPFERPVFTGSLYVFSNNIDELWTEFKDKVLVCYPIENMDYGMREFGIFDNNGYLLQFGMALPENS